MKPLDFIAIVLATWRVASLLVQEDGPYRIFAQLRGKTTFGGALECLWCASVWSGGGVLLLWQITRWPVYALAASAGAILFDKYTE